MHLTSGWLVHTGRLLYILKFIKGQNTNYLINPWLDSPSAAFLTLKCNGGGACQFDQKRVIKLLTHACYFPNPVPPHPTPPLTGFNIFSLSSKCSHTLDFYLVGILRNLILEFAARPPPPGQNAVCWIGYIIIYNYVFIHLCKEMAKCNAVQMAYWFASLM